jgi:hypothetical protein
MPVDRHRVPAGRHERQPVGADAGEVRVLVDVGEHGDVAGVGVRLHPAHVLLVRVLAADQAEDGDRRASGDHAGELQLHR